MPTVCNAPLRRHNSLSPALSLGATFRYIIRKKMGTMDPTFNPVITDDSAAFSQKAVQAMEKERSQMQLDDSYQLLAQMTDYKDSPSCKEKQQCSLTEAKDAFREGANKQVMSSQADSLIKISRIWADFCPANTSNQPI